jgi:hypothetical protein
VTRICGGGATLLSATTGWSTPAAPLDLVHALDGDQPAQLIPDTAGEITANTADALNGHALWPGALLPVAGVEIQAGSGGTLAPSHGDAYNYICVEHPELATIDTVTISYSRPTEPFQGDVRLARVTLQ